MTYRTFRGGEWPDEDLVLSHGQHTAGHAVGILLLDDFYWPFMPGDVANATTFNFPVLHEIVAGSNLAKTKHNDDELARLLIDAPAKLQSQGVRAILGGCGFFGHFQSRLAATLEIPVFLSSLVQIPMVLQAIRPQAKIAVFSDVGSLTDELLAACGVHQLDRITKVHSTGLPETQKQFATGRLNPAVYVEQLTSLARDHVRENPDVAAIVAEYTEFPTFAQAVQDAVGLPVYDTTTLAHWVYDSVARKPFAGRF
ncbi:MAG: Asp/Glu/hydantoin racemase [Gammaproteobacteria bacterium]|jgi:Asp/Glu/hydantoin racemase